MVDDLGSSPNLPQGLRHVSSEEKKGDGQRRGGSPNKRGSRRKVRRSTRGKQKGPGDEPGITINWDEKGKSNGWEP